MILRLLFIWLCCLQLALSGCSQYCSACIQSDIYTYSPYCTSCNPGYYLAGYNCKDCSDCPSCEGCAGTSHTSIIITLCVTIPLLCLVVFCCFQKFKKRRTQQTLAPPQPSPQPPSAINLLPLTGELSKSWKKSAYKLNANETCAICIDNNVFLETNCHHYFHPKCIYEWIIKKQSCPLCKSATLLPLKLYCRRCHTSYSFANLATIHRRILSGKWENCFSCKTSEI